MEKTVIAIYGLYKEVHSKNTIFLSTANNTGYPEGVPYYTKMIYYSHQIPKAVKFLFSHDMILQLCASCNIVELFENQKLSFFHKTFHYLSSR